MAQKIEFLDFKEHATIRSTTWLGSNLLEDNKHWVLNDEKTKFIQANLSVTDALCKIFDEILVNAQDQYIHGPTVLKEYGGAVSEIRVTFNNKTGEFSIYNDGRGFNVEFEKKINMYSVQGAITREYSGSNFKDEDKDRVTGGLNGVGLKLCVTLSKKFTIETVDVHNKLYYKQTCRDNMNIIEEPIVSEFKSLSAEQKKSHTKVRLIPDYAKLCRKKPNQENPDWLNEKNLNDFQKYIEMRLYQTAVFIRCIDYRYSQSDRIEYKKKAKIFLNDQEIKIKDLAAFAQMFGVENMIQFEISDKGESKESIRFPWYVCIGYANSKELAGSGMSIINGVFLSKGGSHVNMLYNQIKDALKENIAAIIKGTNVEFKDSMLKKVLFIIDARQIPLPQFEGGNIKNSIKLGKKELNQMKKTYLIPKKVTDKVWKMIKEVFEYQIQKQDMMKSVKKKRTKKIRKYEKADKAGTKDSAQCGLFIPEGDSAAKPIRDIITSKKTPISFSRYGMYNIQGVPPNVCKKTKEIIIDGEIKIKQDKTLQNNIAFSGLAAALNLDHNCTYHYKWTKKEMLEMIEKEGIALDSELAVKRMEELKKLNKEKRKEGDAEFKKLHYGFIIIATDQDLDGVGNICSLIAVYILVFWPELIKRGFVKRLQTPLIRIYIPGKNHNVINFYSEREYFKWVIENFETEENMPNTYSVEHYKGLAGHTPEEVIEDIGMNINQNIITMAWDDVIRLKMKLYYGQGTGERKEVLLTPVTEEYSEKELESLNIPVSKHFDIESKSFQLYFMRRKLKHAIDGLIPAQRKALAGARIMFRKEGKAKVFQVTGYVTKKLHYQHGDTSMNQTITKMAQAFTGTNNMPIFIPISNGFGDRINGRSITGSPRYIFTKYNDKLVDLLFPREDDWLLEYVTEDGMQAEPRHYVPIWPYSITETTTTTGVGWKIDVFARSYDWTMQNLRLMIKSETIKPFSFMNKVWVPEGMETFIGITPSGKNATEICRGSYTINEQKNYIRITQLPLKIWSYKYKCFLLGIHPKTEKTEDEDGNPYPCKELVEDVIDKTGNDQVDMVVKFKPGAMKKIQEEYGTDCLDPFEDYLNLYQVLSPHLNMFGVDDSIVEFKEYSDVMEYWFSVRKELYKARLERQIVLLELRIKYHENILRFIYMDEKKEINIDKKKAVERTKILGEHGFLCFNKKNLLTPRYIKTNQLSDHILRHGASYKYIDDITKGMTEEDAIADLDKKIKKMHEELESLKNSTWQSIWLEELDQFDKVVKEGIKTNWLFSTKQHNFKRGK